MDLVLLGAMQLCFTRLHIKRLLAAFALLQLFTLFAAGRGMNGVPAGFLHMSVLTLAAAAAIGERRTSRILRAALCLFCASAAAAGCMLIFESSLAAALCGALAAGYLMRRRTHTCFRWNVEIQIELSGRRASIPALIDTGNRLREHRSGLPVLIVEEAAVPELWKAIAGLDASQMRRLSFGVLGSTGEISCFRPDKVNLIEPCFGEICAPPCYVAIYPGRIPGPTRALAPPEFAEALQDQHSVFGDFMERIRRFGHHVIFKRKAVHLRPGGANSEGFGMLHRRQRPSAPSPEP